MYSRTKKSLVEAFVAVDGGRGGGSSGANGFATAILTSATRAGFVRSPRYTCRGVPPSRMIGWYVVIVAVVD